MLIAHRINSTHELTTVPTSCGIEIDLRDYGSDLILAHDPFSKGELFEHFLSNYKHSFIILNIKSERIEWRVLELLDRYRVRNYFFLDSSFPMIVAMSNTGENKIALRFSEFECLDTIRQMHKHIQWVWVDCFNKTPLNCATYSELIHLGLKICLVSPELQGRPNEVNSHIDYFQQQGIKPDMVCTKLHHFKKWQILFN